MNANDLPCIMTVWIENYPVYIYNILHKFFLLYKQK